MISPFQPYILFFFKNVGSFILEEIRNHDHNYHLIVELVTLSANVAFWEMLPNFPLSDGVYVRCWWCCRCTSANFVERMQHQLYFFHDLIIKKIMNIFNCLLIDKWFTKILAAIISNQLLKTWQFLQDIAMGSIIR